MSVEFIYFDVGGVVILDFSGTNKWLEMTSALGVTSDMREEFDDWFSEVEKELCVGKDIETLVPVLKEKFGLTAPEGYSFLKDFVYRFEQNTSIWPILSELKKKYKIGLLTNMYVGMFEMIKERGLLPPIEFDEIIDSSIVGWQKPEPEIYKLAEQKANVEPSKILFVENSPKNLEPAKQLGWNTLLYNPKNVEESNNRLTSLQ